MSHTPGPWKIHNNRIISKTKVIADILDPSRINSATASGSYKSKPFNAALIAAAPEMLKALEDIYNEINMSGCADYMNEASAFSNDFNKTLENVRKAIVKARGES